MDQPTIGAVEIPRQTAPSTRPVVSVAELLEKYTSLKHDFERFDARVDGARLLSDLLSDLAQLARSAGDELLSLQEAALRSGYSPEHLRRLARDGRLPVERRGRRLYFRAGDLPRKPSPVDHPTARPYDPIADARQLSGDRARRTHGSTTNG